MENLTMPQMNVIETEFFFKNTPISNIGGYMRFNQNLKEEVLEKALNEFIKQNDAVRLRIVTEGGTFYQKVTEFENEKIEVVTLDRNENLDEVMTCWMQEKFDMFGKLYNFKIVKYGDEIIWFAKLHHLISDAWSIALMVSKVVEYCEAIEKNIVIETTTTKYLDFVLREKEYINSNTYLKDKEYWEEKYKTKPTYISLTSKSSDFDSTASRIQFTIPLNQKEKMLDYCKNNNLSLAVLFEAAVVLYAARTNNADDVTLCSLVLNRSGVKEKNTLGMYNNIMPMTIGVNWEDTFVNLCSNISKEHFQIFRHQKYPYSNIMKYIRETHGQSNIYDIMVSYQNAAITTKGELKGKVNWMFNGHSELSYMINIDDMNDSGDLTINIDYRNNCFTKDEVKRIYERILNIINQAMKNEQAIVKDIEVVTENEKSDILYKFNNTNKDYPKDRCITSYLSENAIKNPEKIALSFNGNKMTYKEFNEKSNSVANYILQNKLPRNAIVGVMCERSFEMMIAIYGILKAGCVYMPIDPHFPKERIDFMLEDSKAPMIFTQSAWIQNISSNVSKIDLNNFNYDLYDMEKVDSGVNSKDVAYVIYTSGSTGKPKGAQIQHHSVINRIKWMHDKYPLLENDVVLQKTPYTFDVSVWELFWWSMYNQSLEILIPEGHKDPQEIINAIETGKVTHMHFVPSMLNAFLEYLGANKELVSKLKTLKYVFASGEALQSEHVKKIYELLGDNGTTLHNLYGPTECTVDVSYYDCDKNNIPESIPIGKPIDNTQLLILDKACKLLPIGVGGELHISGVLVGKGYINREELTKEKFIKNDFYDSDTMYKTGDLARWLPDGNIEYLGRIDNQVKIRGLRVELGDIETAILKYDSMSNCVVTVVEINGEKYLCAYFTATKKVDTKDLKKNLLKVLPEYMVPTYYVELEKMPLNHNGKIDRKSLPKPSLEDDEEYVAPSDEIEEQIQNIVNKIIKKEKLSVTSDLLNSGLSSLGVITIITELSIHDWNIKVKDFYECRTIRSIANKIKNSKEDADNYDEDRKYENISDIRRVNVDGKESGSILLTGVTGFLGIHVLREILLQTDKKVYCLVRKPEKLEKYIAKYINESFDIERIIPIIGDITDDKLSLSEESYNEILADISDIIHCAANVSYFCPWETAKKVNYIGTYNIIKLAEDAKAKLHHISTMSVSGDVLTEQTMEHPIFDESKLFIGQLYKDNVYAHSKYLAEREIIKAIRELRINASIYRVPNLTWRMSDGMFQENFYDNDLYILTRVMKKLEKIPLELKDEDFLISPVDDLSKAIVTLMLKKKNNDIYHLVSTYSPTIENYMNALVKCEEAPIKEIFKELNMNSEDSEMKFVSMYLAGILKDAEKMVVQVNSNRTNAILADLGYTWNQIDNKYINRINDVNK